MIENNKLKIEFLDCNDLEKEILEKYWNCNKNGDYDIPLTHIMKDYNLKQSELYTLASNKSKVIWDFGFCACGEPISARLTKRTDLTSCLRNKGTVNTYLSVEYYSKCYKCNDEENKKRIFEFETQRLNSYNSFFSELHKQPDNINETLSKIIRGLSPYEIKLLYQIYQLKNFNLIRDSNEIFPVKYGEHKTFVWKTLFKFDNLGLISADKRGSYINDIEFFETVEEILNHMIGELEPLIEQMDLEITMIRVTDGNKTKYFTILEPETDIILRAGNKYEFVANTTSDKNLLLRAINIQTISSSEFKPKSKMNEDNHFDDIPY